MSLAAFSLPVKLSVFGDSHLKISFTVGPDGFIIPPLGSVGALRLGSMSRHAAHFSAPLGLDTRITGLAFGQEGLNIRTNPSREKRTTPKDRCLSAGPSPFFVHFLNKAAAQLAVYFKPSLPERSFV